MTSQQKEDTRLIGVLAHELRNPLASLQGCAMTLLDRADELSRETRDGLTKVIVGQSQRLDWLVRATAAFGGAAGRLPNGPVNPAAIVTEATEFTSVPAAKIVDGPGFPGDARRVRLAIEALLIALQSGGADVAASMPGPSTLEVRSSAKDLEQGERRWKLDLARRLLREEGCSLTVRRTSDGTRSTIRFGVGREAVRGSG